MMEVKPQIALRMRFLCGERYCSTQEVAFLPHDFSPMVNRKFENWLARTLLFVVSYLVVFHIIFYGLEIVRFLLFAPALPKVDIEIASPIIWIVWASDIRINILITTAWTVFAISFFMLGSLVFPRKPLLGTTISAFILVLIGGLLSLFFAMPGEYSFYFVSAWIGILGVMNLWLSYRRLCELEVIDRM